MYKFILVLFLSLAPQVAHAEYFPFWFIMFKEQICRKQTAPPNHVIASCAEVLRADTDGTSIADHIYFLAGAYYRKNQPELGQKHHAFLLNRTIKLLEDRTKDVRHWAWLMNLRCWSKGISGLELDTAVADCDRALEANPGRAEILDSKAFVYYRMGKYQDALLIYNAALDAKPDFASSLYMRGIIKAKLGDDSGSKTDGDAARLANADIEIIYQSYGIAPVTR